ncbi:RluA family pseudouridine synthase [Candidatus Parcubacteria bacterium]|nr:RluA family pseudouridine synthase [Candidatus Parcubacteria bacterium]
MAPEILYEDDDILAVNKPAGLVVHSDGRTKEPSVSSWFVEKYPESKDVGEPLGNIERSGVVHRIDRETSGVLLLAKTKEGHACLKEQFQNHEIDKIYHAFLYGNLKEDHGSINLPIGKSNSDFRKRSAERGAKGDKKEALTYYRVLARGDGWTFIEAKPKTGRTHQIRVHFKALHHPVVSDKLYASKKESLLGFDRLALHAKEITFTDTKGQKHIVVAPYPKDFEQALTNTKIGV